MFYRQPDQNQIQAYETRLSTSLQPVGIDDEFVTSLRTRLMNRSEMEVELPSRTAVLIVNLILSLTIISLNLAVGLLLLKWLVPGRPKPG